MYGSFTANANLKPFCTYKIGGKAKYLAEVFDNDGLLRAMELSDNRIVIGRGSKILFSDKGFDGAVIVMRCSAVRFLDGGVYAAAGAALPMLSRLFASKGLAGMEWASGIPGTVGGALKMNAGAFGGDMSQSVLEAEVLRGGKTVRLSADECGFGYRCSGFAPSDVILGAVFKAEQADKAQIERLIGEYTAKRAAAQPKGNNCGSVFKSGAEPAWKYIDGSGLKGVRVGGAQISEKHANFIINTGGATAKDVLALIRTAKAEAFTRYGVKLNEEVITAGEF